MLLTSCLSSSFFVEFFLYHLLKVSLSATDILFSTDFLPSVPDLSALDGICIWIFAFGMSLYEERMIYYFLSSELKIGSDQIHLETKTVFFFLGKQQISGLFTFAQNSIIEKSKMHLFKKSLFFSSSSKNVSTEQSNICLFIYFNCIHNQANP